MFSTITIILSGLVFAAIHSLLASQRLKALAYGNGLTPQHYRFLYVVIAIILTAAWLAYIHRLPDQALYSLQGTLRWLCYGLQTLAILAFWFSLRPIDTLAFLGLQQFKNNKEDFIEQGIYRYLRHPMYSSLMVLMFAMPTQSHNSLTLYALISAYFIIGSRLEEQRMIHEHPEYADYRQRVAAFIPCRRAQP